ncbi:uncharacterized protein LOC128681138 isoform X3 [Plodia interpunctella]|nr:uncharacterized protein LOC128681138 isoform X3 [Plodia interpunctella]
MKLLLEGSLKSKVCRYCLNVVTSLYEMDQVFQIGGQTALYKVTIRDMVASFYPFQVVEDPNCPTKICDKCLDNAFQSYLFTQQCERAGRALLNCFEDMYEKLDKLDPLERTKKRGRQKLNPNYNTLYTEHEKVIDYADPIINILNKGSEAIDKKDDTVSDLECPRCWQTFTSLESLINHEKIHPKSMWFHCRLCGKSFVKRHLYRKHIKTNHNTSNVAASALSDRMFKCLDCDVISETYDKHLQHIEKHKFKMVMEHLVDRKMDRLCTVCLAKETNMVKLDKTVNLHGGCPELTGHRSLYNILGSTMPEQASYKYQELMVPHEAKILTITKKQDFKLFRENMNFSVISDGEYYYSLSNPIIISRETLQGEDYIFFFTKPDDIDQIINDKENFDEEIQNNNKIKHYDATSSIIELPLLASFTSNIINFERNTNSEQNSDQKSNQQKYIFSFSNPDYDIDVEKDTSIGKISDNMTTENCKVDWVFDKCNESNDNAKVKCDKAVVAIINECNYCWIFKSTDKCNNCLKPNCKDNLKNDTININETNESQQDNEVLSNKRKQNDLNDFVSKKSKWQCKFCLTANGNNKKCICCDTEYHIKDLDHHMKFNLGVNKNFFETDVSEKVASVDSNDVNLVTVGTSDKLTIDVSLKVSNEHDDETLQEINSNVQSIGNEIINTRKHLVVNLKEDEYMDTEFRELEKESSHNVTNDFQEEMDVEECNISCNVNTLTSREMGFIVNPSAQFPPSSVKITNIPLKFNIGAGTSDGRICRRPKRPIRRMATSFHK